MNKIIEKQANSNEDSLCNSLSFILLIGISENEVKIFQDLKNVVEFEVNFTFLFLELISIL